MPKADGDPRTRDVAEAGRDRADVSTGLPNAESSNVKSSAATSEDDIPPVHVLEAAQHQDRKEAEDLLSGFDRPGRGPKPASSARDFVEYYAKKKGPPGGAANPARAPGAPQAAASSPAAGVKQIDVATVITPRKREGVPAWLLWPAAGLLMLVIGSVVGFLATSDHDRAPGSAKRMGPSGSNSLTGVPLPGTSNDNIPPPDLAAMTGATTTAMTVIEPGTTAPTTASSPDASPRGSAKREPRGTASAPAGATGASTSATQPAGARPPRGTNADDPKPPPRDDFIRDL